MWNSSNYGNDLEITMKQAESCSHSGECEPDVKELMLVPKIRRQLNKLNSTKLVKDLTDYGAWTEEELTNHQDNLMRWLWISCCDITERKYQDV